jgi:branched-chain amino acid transport system ATP-binding protein
MSITDNATANAAKELLQVNDVTVRFGGVVALDSLSFTIREGEICALIGPNGAGKTTLFNVVSRVYDPTSGSVTYDGKDLVSLAPHKIANVGIGRTFQNLALWKGLTVLENVMVGMHPPPRPTSPPPPSASG